MLKRPEYSIAFCLYEIKMRKIKSKKRVVLIILVNSRSCSGVSTVNNFFRNKLNKNLYGTNQYSSPFLSSFDRNAVIS